jgi:hypothetical protein
LKAAVNVLSAGVYKAQREVLFASLSDAGKLLLELAAAPGARAWADAMPRFAYHKLSDAQARVAYSLWLGATITELVGRTDPTGRDLLRAAPPARRHTAVLRAHLLAGVQTGARTYQEVEGLFPAWGLSQVAVKDRRADHGELRRMDMVLEQDMQLIYADPTLVDGLTAGDVEARTRNAEAPRAVVAAEADKVKYYGPDVPAGTSFFACGYDTLTGCGKGAKEFQHLLAVRTAWRANEGNPPSAHLVDFKALDIRQRIGIAVMRACADSLITQFARSPHAALTAKKRFNAFAVAPPPPRLEDASAF